MKRIAAASCVLALAAALAPSNGASAMPAERVPAHRMDIMIKLKGDHHWVGKDVYDKPKVSQVDGVLRSTPGRVVAFIRVVNTGTETSHYGVWASSIRYSFYGGAHWPTQTTLDPGKSITFKYVAHRGSAEDGDTMPDDFTIRRDGKVVDGVRLLLIAK